jgi:uncharacterized protein YfkK (UPF0435 family)
LGAGFLIDFFLRTWKDDYTTIERMNGVDLTKQSPENVDFMIEKIKEKLNVMNLGAIKSSHFDGEMYEELVEIYEMIMKKNNFSPNELQAIAEELGNLRKQ